MTSPAEATAAAALGADALIVQGIEAGGHRGVFVDDDAQSELTAAGGAAADRAAGRSAARRRRLDHDRRRARRRARRRRQRRPARHRLPAQHRRPGTSAAQRDATATDAPTVLTRAFSGRLARGIVNRWHREHGAARAARLSRDPSSDLAAARPRSRRRRPRSDQPVGRRGARAGAGAARRRRSRAGWPTRPAGRWRPRRNDWPDPATEADTLGPVSGAVTRRGLLRSGVLGAAVIASGSALRPAVARAAQPADAPLPAGVYDLNGSWLFGGVYAAGAEATGLLRGGLRRRHPPPYRTPAVLGRLGPQQLGAGVDLPRHINRAAVAGQRVFLHFQAVMTSATVYLERHADRPPRRRLPAVVGRADRRPELGRQRDRGASSTGRWLDVPPDGHSRAPRRSTTCSRPASTATSPCSSCPRSSSPTCSPSPPTC